MARITFILPELSLAGGIRVIGKYSQALVLLGHQVSVVTRQPSRPSLRDLLLGRTQKNISSQVVKSYFSGIEDTVTFISPNRPLLPSDLPDADFLIATWWETVEWVSTMPISKGQLVHLMQGYEMFPWLPLKRVAATYKEDTVKISVSNWVARQVFENHGRLTRAVIHNAVDTNHFSFVPDRNNSTLTLGCVYSPASIKNSHLAFETQDVLASRNIPCELIALHSIEMPKNLKERSDLQSHYCPPPSINSIALSEV